MTIDFKFAREPRSLSRLASLDLGAFYETVRMAIFYGFIFIWTFLNSILIRGPYFISKLFSMIENSYWFHCVFFSTFCGGLIDSRQQSVFVQGWAAITSVFSAALGGEASIILRDAVKAVIPANRQRREGIVVLYFGKRWHFYCYSQQNECRPAGRWMRLEKRNWPASAFTV